MLYVYYRAEELTPQQAGVPTVVLIAERYQGPFPKVKKKGEKWKSPCFYHPEDASKLLCLFS